MKNCEGCKCANCVRNFNLYMSTTGSCHDLCCDICDEGLFGVAFCTQHLTLTELNTMVELVKKGLTYSEAYAIIKA